MAKQAGIARFTFNWGLGISIALYDRGVEAKCFGLKEVLLTITLSLSIPGLKRKAFVKK